MHISHTHKDGKAEVVAQFHIWAVEEGIRKIKSYIRFCLKERKRERRVEGGGRGREGEGEGEAGGGGGRNQTEMKVWPGMAACGRGMMIPSLRPTWTREREHLITKTNKP
jgi:hypothetical protein